MGFMTWSMDVGLLSRNSSDWIDSRHRLYRQGEVSELEICGEMVQVYAGLREEELRRAAAEFFRTHIESHIFPEMQDLVARLKAEGADVWAVSSTNNWVIEEGMRRFSIHADHILSARVKVSGGLVTSELIDVPTDEYKAEALKRSGIPAPDAVFGNSIHDAAMLELAGQPFPVNPTPGLLDISARLGWTVYYPQAVLTDHIK
ncbi:haloacid dehalogenase-like hydrolase [Acidipila sp. 4G-K13]|uniref:Haloacid dehalogenase-like hydrolase n=2 Tax=Paracidobacterium acidisoli TaxID=2303751 RepID=A0A372ISL5_9BACT|nr:haloacid dehalogenase-like hydrolase [Paracidobacterium acidisoli]